MLVWNVNYNGLLKQYGDTGKSISLVRDEFNLLTLHMINISSMSLTCLPNSKLS